MDCSINYEGRRISFSIPAAWELISSQDRPPVPGVADTVHLKSFGISYIMQVVFFKEPAEKFRVIHVTEGLSPDQVRMMKFSYGRNIGDAIEETSGVLPRAGVAVFPSGGNIIPEIRGGT